MLLDLALMIFTEIIFEALPREKLHMRDCRIKKHSNPAKLTKTTTEPSIFPKLQNKKHRYVLSHAKSCYNLNSSARLNCSN